MLSLFGGKVFLIISGGAMLSVRLMMPEGGANAKTTRTCTPRDYALLARRYARFLESATLPSGEQRHAGFNLRLSFSLSLRRNLRLSFP
jgi:hypothetical protein